MSIISFLIIIWITLIIVLSVFMCDTDRVLLLNLVYNRVETPLKAGISCRNKFILSSTVFREKHHQVFPRRIMKPYFS